MQQVGKHRPLAQPISLKLIAAFGAIYVIWGSTFLALRYAVESIPPLLMTGIRSVVAGAILYCWVRLRQPEPLGWQQWCKSAVGGVCFFVLCNGCMAWAAQRVPSGIAAVILALIPVWIVLLDWLRPSGKHPGRLVLLGVAIGFGGLLLLIGPGLIANDGSGDTVATTVLALAALAWAGGTIYSRYARIDASPIAVSAMQLLTGGGMLLLVGVCNGEWHTFVTTTIDVRAWLSLGYLTLIGSLLAFSVYIWLLHVSSPARVATYAYVNPVVAVLLGWFFAGEQFTPRMALAAAVIVLAVVIIITFQSKNNTDP